MTKKLHTDHRWIQILHYVQDDKTRCLILCQQQTRTLLARLVLSGLLNLLTRVKQERDSIDLGRFFLFLATLVSMSYLIINEETLQTIRCNNLDEIGVNWDGKAIRGISTTKGKKKANKPTTILKVPLIKTNF